MYVYIYIHTLCIRIHAHIHAYAYAARTRVRTREVGVRSGDREGEAIERARTALSSRALLGETGNADSKRNTYIYIYIYKNIKRNKHVDAEVGVRSGDVLHAVRVPAPPAAAVLY